MPSPNEAPSHEGHVDDVGRTTVPPLTDREQAAAQAGERAAGSIGAVWAGEPLPKATANYLDERPARTVGVRTRTRTVMRLAFDSTDRAAYFKSDTEELCPIALAWSVWIDMGRPDRITVTIEPGDRLNG